MKYLKEDNNQNIQRSGLNEKIANLEADLIFEDILNHGTANYQDKKREVEELSAFTIWTGTPTLEQVIPTSKSCKQ